MPANGIAIKTPANIEAEKSPLVPLLDKEAVNHDGILQAEIFMGATTK